MQEEIWQLASSITTITITTTTTIIITTTILPKDFHSMSNLIGSKGKISEALKYWHLESKKM